MSMRKAGRHSRRRPARQENSAVDVSVRSGKLVIVPVEGVTLQSLVERITEDNRHEEVSTGQPTGNEIRWRPYVPERGDVRLQFYPQTCRP